MMPGNLQGTGGTRRRRETSAAKQVSQRAFKAETKSKELSRLTRTAGFLAVAVLVSLLAALYSYTGMNMTRSLASTMITHKINYRKDSYSKGLMYYNGYVSEEKNITLAIEHFRRAADDGEPNAGTALGMLYLKGDDVPKNVKTAMRWFERSADLGETRAMSVLCFLHYSGHVDQTRDYLMAAKRCRAAAEAGDAHAQFNLGVMVAHGQGEEQDLLEAYKWLAISMKEIGELAIDAINSIKPRMSLEEVETAHHQAQLWKRTHHMQKHKGVRAALWAMLESAAGRSAGQPKNQGGHDQRRLKPRTTASS